MKRKFFLIGCLTTMLSAVILAPFAAKENAEFESPRPKTIVAEFEPPISNVTVNS